MKENETIILLNISRYVFELDGANIARLRCNPQGTITYVWIYEDAGHEMTYSFNSDDRCYIFSGIHTEVELQSSTDMATMEGTWTENNDEVTIFLMGEEMLTLYVENGELTM